MFQAATTPPRFATLVLLTGLATLSLNMFLPSLPAMAEEFQVDYALVSLAIAGYLGITAFLQIIIGPLSDRYGRRPVLLAALLVFAIASTACALATDVYVFLAFRVLQGAIVSGWAISLAVVRDTRDPQEAASVVGFISMCMAVAPMLGPMVGGVLDELFGWRANFIAYAVLGTVALLLCWADLGETNQNRSATLRRQMQIYPQLLANTRFWGYAVCSAFSTGAFYVFLAGTPLVAAVEFDMAPSTLGFFMGTITAGFMFGSFLSGRFAKRTALPTMMVLGRTVACGGLAAGLVLLAAGLLDKSLFFAATVFVGIGNGLTMPSSNTGAVSVRPDLAGSASGLTGALTVGAGAILTTVTGLAVSAGNGVYMLLTIMLLSSAVGLAAALFVRRAEGVLAGQAT